ncbi:hypothetical protein [Acaryochloris thomasi]|uniref:hypothetical protein n=1 Tax=Acaryochloris thomasi TaxID=2929456 RepID=UPI000DA6477D|nr:hypothetical protein [Acaryochloris thomasi]
MGLLNRQGQPRHLDWVDEQTQQLQPIPNPLRQQILTSPGLTRFPIDHDPALAESRNIVVTATANQPLLLVARPVLTSTSEGPGMAQWL